MSQTPWQACYPLLTSRWLEAEQVLMARIFPQFRLVWMDPGLAFRGPLVSNFGSQFMIELTLPPRYPEEEPWLWILSPELPDNTQHRYADGRICAHADPFMPRRTTAATMISVMAGWLFRFDRCRLEGVDWEEPIGSEAGAFGVNPDGTLYLEQGPSSPRGRTR